MVDVARGFTTGVLKLRYVVVLFWVVALGLGGWKVRSLSPAQYRVK
jgi:hypothetical protein